MLTVDIGALKPTQLSSLEPGTFFFYGRYPGQALAVALEKEGQHVLWLDVSGERKFILGGSDRGMTVYPVFVEPTRIVLKVDPASFENPAADHAVGLLMVGDEGATISCRWDNDPSCRYGNVVTLSTWAQSHADITRLRFARWALGYTDSAGNWVGLVSSE